MTYHFYGDLELIQFDFISAKGVNMCSGERWIVERLQLEIVQPQDGIWRWSCSRDLILAYQHFTVAITIACLTLKLTGELTTSFPWNKLTFFLLWTITTAFIFEVLKNTLGELPNCYYTFSSWLGKYLIICYSCIGCQFYLTYESVLFLMIHDIWYMVLSMLTMHLV